MDCERSVLHAIFGTPLGLLNVYGYLLSLEVMFTCLWHHSTDANYLIMIMTSLLVSLHEIKFFLYHNTLPLLNCHSHMTK